jgi:hypothetical protein
MGRRSARELAPGDETRPTVLVLHRRSTDELVILEPANLDL